MTPRRRLYCYLCRRSLSVKAFNLPFWEGAKVKVCQSCIERLQEQGIMVTQTITVESEALIQMGLQEREGGEREVDTPAGAVDLVTDEHVIEIKHVTDWKDGVKVLVYAMYFPERKPRIHLFGGYTRQLRALVDEVMEKLGIVLTWERDPY